MTIKTIITTFILLTFSQAAQAENDFFFYGDVKSEPGEGSSATSNLPMNSSSIPTQMEHYKQKQASERAAKLKKSKEVSAKIAQMMQESQDRVDRLRNTSAR